MKPQATMDPRRGFSLIEILIAIIILALGLLGLGAVFPVVIREQKLAQDRIAGTLAEDNIRATLRGFARLNQRPTYVGVAQVGQGRLEATYSGWATLQEEWNYYRELSNPSGPAGRVDFTRAFDFSREGLWAPYWGAWNNAQSPNAFPDFATTGDQIFCDEQMLSARPREEFPPDYLAALIAELKGLGEANPQPVTYRGFAEFRIPLSARLNPTGDPGDGTPIYVWDLTARRKLEGSDPRALQVAVFARRVDPRLRPIPRTPPVAGNDTITVREQILNTGQLGNRNRLPVGEDSQGLPTLDGTGGGPGTLNYSGIHTIDVSFIADPGDPVGRKRQRIQLLGGSNSDRALVRQIGQRVVDNLGNIYTVTGLDGADIKVDPPVPPSVLDTVNDPRLASIRQLAFTPQIPVLVFVMEVEP